MQQPRAGLATGLEQTLRDLDTLYFSRFGEADVLRKDGRLFGFVAAANRDCVGDCVRDTPLKRSKSDCAGICPEWARISREPGRRECRIRAISARRLLAGQLGS